MKIRLSPSWLVIASSLLAAPLSHALEFTQVGFGMSRAVPMANPYVAFGATTGFQVEALATTETFGPNYKFHLAMQYQGYDLRNTATASYNLVSVLGGFTAQYQPVTGKGRAGSPAPFFNPFFSVLLGGAIDWLNLPGGNANIVTSFGGTIQAIPGIEFPIFDRLSGSVSFPIQAFFLGNGLYIWNSMFHLRWAL